MLGCVVDVTRRYAQILMPKDLLCRADVPDLLHKLGSKRVPPCVQATLLDPQSLGCHGAFRVYGRWTPKVTSGLARDAALVSCDSPRVGWDPVSSAGCYCDIGARRRSSSNQFRTNTIRDASTF